MIYAIGVIVLVLVILVIVLFFKYSKLKDIKNSIEMCSEQINEVLDKKYKLISDILKDIDDEKIKNSFSYDENGSLYDKENSLFNISFEVNKFIKEHKKKDLADKIKELNILEENIEGLKDYYNTNVLGYNEIFLKKGLNKFFKLFKFDQYKSFKIRKLEEYEIFKN